MREQFGEQLATSEKRPEVITDAQRVREAMRDFWHREVDSKALKSDLELEKSLHQADLLRLGYEMAALMRIMAEEEKELPTDPSRFLLASLNETKLKMVGEASAGQGMFLQETMFHMGQEEEEFEHKILGQLINERKSKYAPKTLRTYAPAYFAIDVAEAKALKMRETHKGQAILGADIVVLCGNRILEKPGNTEEALETLKTISGKKVRVAFGVVLLTPTSLGKTVSLKEGGYFNIKLRDFSEKEASDYLDERGRASFGVVGGIDYTSPMSQGLLSGKPVEVMPLQLRRQIGENQKSIIISPAILPQLKDYFMGVPKELIQEMLRRGKLLQEGQK